MTHIVIVEDAQGDLVDLNHYCSDLCAQTDPSYGGWYGATENYTASVCHNCGTPIFWYNQDENRYYLGSEPVGE